MKRPDFCPNRDCIHHHRNRKSNPTEKTGKWYKLFGKFKTKIRGAVQRFQCLGCRITFSEQTFSLTHRFRKPGMFDCIFKGLRNSSGIRGISRNMNVSPKTIQLRISKMARQAILLHAELTADIDLKETLVADGFESFAVSQYFPNNINLLAGKDSQFIYAFDYSHLRRKGRMTDRQKIVNIKMKERFVTGKSVRSSFITLSHTINELMWRSSLEKVTINTDRKKEYYEVFKSFPFCKPLIHKRSSSKRYRNYANPLFAVNYLDREIRKDCAEHTRETTQHARNVNNSMERLALYSFYHNYIKPFRINRKKGFSKEITHGEIAGIKKPKIEKGMKSFFSKRKFLTRTENLQEQDIRLFFRTLRTPLKKWAEPSVSYAA